MKTGIVGSAACFAAAVVAGTYVALTSWNGVIYIANSKFPDGSRNPAAIRKDLDFSRLDGAELITASQKRLVTAARILLQDDELGVELGHFVTKGTDGRRQLACDFYDRLALRFEAEGIADSGEKPVMEIEGPCRTSNDITRIEPVWIPVEKILAEHPADMDLNYPEQEGFQFSFVHMGTQWPENWSLQAVRLYNASEPGREVIIKNRDLREILPKPIVLNWQAVRQ